MQHFIAPFGPNPLAVLRVGVIADVGETYIDGAQYHWMEPFSINTTTGELTAWESVTAANLRSGPDAGSNPHNWSLPSLSGKSGPPAGHVLRSFSTGLAQADLMLHIGDLSYATGYESEWDYFMSQIAPIGSIMP